VRQSKHAATEYPQALAGKGYLQGLAGWPATQANATNSNQVGMETEATGAVGSSLAAKRPPNTSDELQRRELWTVGSCLEVFSSTASKWYIAQVRDMPNAHMVTVQFVGDNGQILQKSMPRTEPQLATFGRNTRLLPPNFQKVTSQSRPGQFSYQDSESGAKYQTNELAWENYYDAILSCEQAMQLLRSRA
jgi:hypothetical protein